MQTNNNAETKETAYQKRKNLINNIVIYALFIALLALFTFVPYLGTYQIGIISFTSLHIIVIIAACLFGWKKGLILGTVMGLFTLFKALTFPGTADFFFVNPFISVIPRALFGFLSGLMFDLTRKFEERKFYYPLIIGISSLSALLHTTIVVLFWYIFGILDIFGISAAIGIDLSVFEQFKNFLLFVSTFLVWGSLIEIVAAGAIVPVVYLAKKKSKK